MSEPQRRGVVEVTVAPDGGVSVEAKGFVGPACQDATRELERALGLTTSKAPTPEMYVGSNAPTREDHRA